MNSDKNKTTDTIKSLLKLKNAPKGDVSSDFETALYLVAAIYHLDFSKPSHRGMCSHLFGSIGFKGDLSKYTSDDYTNTLKALVDKGALVKQGSSESYIASGAATTFVAKVRTVADNTLKDSFGEKNYLYVISDDSGNEYRLNSEYVVLPNDEVEVSVSKNSDVAFVNRITKVRQCILGRIMLLGKKATLMPDEPNLKQLQFEFESREDLGEARSGDVVIAQITRRCSASLFTIKTREVVHDIGNLNNIIVMAVLRNDIPNVWPDNLIKSLSRIPDKVSEKETEGRTDLRTVPLMTIDGEDARDFDDAVYCKKEGNTFRLFVSIADVSTYVKPGTLLDKEAVNRCNSCYFPNYVIPMLPEKLSNGICSLNPDVDRLCMTCEMIITEDGKIKQYRFYPAVMRSHARLTYTEAWQMISEGKAKYKEHEFAIPLVKDLYDLYKAFLKNRRNRGAMSIESQELHFVFDENMEIEGVAPLDRNDAHKLIEECMIAANVAAAEFVCEHKYHTLYRIHPKPTEKKLAQLEGQLSRFGLFLTGGDEPSPKDFMKLSDIVAKREDARVINEMILRGMSKAQYHPDNIGHYGLALEKYAHFTSPIRRYADLQLHRVIKYILEKETEHAWGKIGSRAYTKQELVALGAKCTDREIAADVAEREVDAALACIFMEKFIGETVEGTVTGVSSFGVFVHLDDYGVDGMIYVGNFKEYMEYDEKAQTLRAVSSKDKDTYYIGKQVKVVVADVNFDERKVDLYPGNQPKSVIKNLLKQREYLVAKRRNISENAQTQNKEDILSRLSDISSARDALQTDLVLRGKPKSRFAPGNFVADSESALNMDQIKLSGNRRKKGKR